MKLIESIVAQEQWKESPTCARHDMKCCSEKSSAAALEKVTSYMNYGFFLDYQFAFKFPSHPGRGHLCVVDGESDPPRKRISQFAWSLSTEFGLVR